MCKYLWIKKIGMKNIFISNSNQNKQQQSDVATFLFLNVVIRSALCNM